MSIDNEAVNSKLIITTSGPIRTLVLNRPDSMNALDVDLMRLLLNAVRDAAEDDSVRCVVLRGRGKAFCAGGDIRAMAAAAKARAQDPAKSGQEVQPVRRSSFEKRVQWVRRSADTSRIIHEMPKPAIAMINGACGGAGLSLAAACDFRIAGASARLRPAFLSGGLSGDYGGAWLWTGILGTARARQLYLRDVKRTADEALAFGLVDEVCADEALEARVMQVAEELSALPGAAAAYAKENLNAALTESLAQSLDRESRNMLLSRDALSNLSEGKK